MKAVIELELIGDNYVQYERAKRVGRVTREESPHEAIRAIRYGRKELRPWVARITGLDDKYGFKREFVNIHTKDYARANSVGSRGVYAYYVLDPGIYEVNQRLTWEKARRYFIRVESDAITEISRDEVLEWLRNECSASAS